MVNDLEKLANLGGTVVTVIAFLYFMSKQNHEFNTTIQNHLHHSNKVIDKNSGAMIKISSTLKELCMMLKKTNKGERGEQGEQGKQGIHG